MGKREVQCAHCDHTFEIDEDFAVESLPCPSCKARIALPPLPDADPSARQKLLLKKDEVISGSMKRCPLCDSSATQEAVICLTCGYDWRIGRQRHPGFRPSVLSLPRLLLIAVLVAAAAALAYVYLLKNPGPEPLPPPVEEPAPTQPVAVNPAPAAADAGAPAAAPSGPAQPVAEEPAGTSEAEIAAMAGELRDSVARMLDTRAPMYEKNNPVVFRKTNGIIQRGMYLGVKGDVAVLMQEKAMIEIPLAELDRETRMRCDETYRSRYVEFLVAKRMRQPAGRENPTGF